MNGEPVLTLEGVSLGYPLTVGPFGRVVGYMPALDAITIALRKGEVLGLLGESGSGKSTLGRVMLGLLKPDTGIVSYRGQSLEGMSAAERMAFRRKAQLIFQDPLSALNPMMTVAQLVTEPLRIQRGLSRAAIGETAAALLSSVSLDPDFAERYPAELSGGQRQRVVIARALSVQPDLVVADEPVSALDVSVQAQIIELLTSLRRSMQLTMLFISHDIAVVRYVADRIAVLYRGTIVEVGAADVLMREPRHPYTRALLAASPDFVGRFDAGTEARLAGPVSHSGCVFHHRCAFATVDCRAVVPRLRKIGTDHSHACAMER
jgi:oligopeptide/dipeptide ABC transporter ATP-binding protein